MEKTSAVIKLTFNSQSLVNTVVSAQLSLALPLCQRMELILCQPTCLPKKCCLCGMRMIQRISLPPPSSLKTKLLLSLMVFIAWDLRWPLTQTLKTRVLSWLHQTRFAIKSVLKLANLPASAVFLMFTIRILNNTLSLNQLRPMAMPGAILTTTYTHTSIRKMMMTGLMLFVTKINQSEINSRQTKRLKPLGQWQRLISSMPQNSKSSLTKRSRLNQMWLLMLPLVILMFLITAVPHSFKTPSLHSFNNPQILALTSHSPMLPRLTIFAVLCSLRLMSNGWVLNLFLILMLSTLQPTLTKFLPLARRSLMTFRSLIKLLVMRWLSLMEFLALVVKLLHALPQDIAGIIFANLIKLLSLMLAHRMMLLKTHVPCHSTMTPLGANIVLMLLL